MKREAFGHGRVKVALTVYVTYRYVATGRNKAIRNYKISWDVAGECFSRRREG